MTDADDMLFEIGAEELPPKTLLSLAEALEKGIVTGLDQAQLAHGPSCRFATPRRLAVLVNNVANVQPEQRFERRGPALKTAFDGAGRPTTAAVGFARSCGADVAELETLETERGSWLVYVERRIGESAAELLPAIIGAAIDDLPLPKRMRWGAGDTEFVRPVRWVVLMYGGEAVPGVFWSLTAGNRTFGHRFHHPGAIALTRPGDYVEALRDEGYVIADFEQRRRLIRDQAEALATEVNGRALIPAELLDEVTALVEWPVALRGDFEPRFLDVPHEALVTTMQDNQKSFPVVDCGGRLLPHFIAVANVVSRDPAQVVAGNERVIRPRFSDAEFFWQQDRKQPLATRRGMLKHVVFQHQLGTLYDKSQRLVRLGGYVASVVDANTVIVRRAAELAKCDLVTDMVQEFPELQGTMGCYYARHDGEPEEVAVALREQYLPRFAGDDLPATQAGQVLALAERLDTMIGIFAIGQAPTGARDPFALRRAALGIVRLQIESHQDIDLMQLLRHAAEGYLAAAIDAASAVEPVFEFVLDRMRGYYHERGFKPDVFEAVLACRPTRLVDFDRRLRAVVAFGELPEAASLTTANKRIRNILRKAGEDELPTLREELLVEPAEQALTQEMAGLAVTVEGLMMAGDYELALQQLAALRDPIDRFFDEVMVMVEDRPIRINRLALLDRLSGLFGQVADLSRLQG